MVALLATLIIGAPVDSILDNGLRLRVVPMEGARNVSIQVLVRGGSVFEAVPGQAHFVEHLLFRRGLEPDRRAERAGGELNATTFREFMRFEFFGPAGSWKEGLACVASLLRPPSLTADDMALEARIIGEEIAVRRQVPFDVAVAGLWSQACNGTPYAAAAMGDAQAIAKTEKGRLLEFYGKQFGAKNMRVVVAGAVDDAQVRETVRKEFSEMPAGQEVTIPEFSAVSVAHDREWALHCPGVNEPTKYAACVALVDVLSRRLAPAVRFEMGPSAAGSICAIVAEPNAELNLAGSLSTLLEQDIKDGIARVGRSWESIDDAGTMALIQGFGLLFGRPELLGDLRNAAKTLTVPEVRAFAGSWLKEIKG